jgi:hypothetical protein
MWLPAISLVPASVARSVHDTLCSRILFYSQRPDSPDPEAEYLPVEEVADLGRRLWRDGIPLKVAFLMKILGLFPA